ncbi:chloride channel protein [Acuticoccus sp. MNP-M23]|uniref:chloride channel protein n=1 Tax=Acuticoccus sp. MNP-M23 TaxID=3072793 RepID=UPI0028155EE1|nr:chloride channel protein [Acuticoccus sp. MNP-M23]WMS41171.1 chloride channel protein [Acuticoccus sp. MNP-M23]
MERTGSPPRADTARDADEDAAADDAAQDARAEVFDEILATPPRRTLRRSFAEHAGGKMTRSVLWCRQTYARSAGNVTEFATSRDPALWLIAVIVGAAVGGAAVLFRLGIDAVQWLWLGVTSERIIAAVSAQPWWVIIGTPVLGGAIVGLLNQFVLPGRRPHGVADVIEASARGGAGLSLRTGLASAFATIVSLGAGASAGREGPVIHLGATVATGLTTAIKLPPMAGRVILACGVASAISASFNAPIAGVLFAHEVVLRHYAMRAFVPIVIASVAGTLAGRYFIGDVAAFEIPAYTIGSYWEMPAFAILGVVAALVAIAFQFALIIFDQSARAVIMPTWLRPVIGGFIIGFIGLYLPEILGVGYEATDTALQGGFAFTTMLLLIVAKIVATAVTLASRFGGGIFSPALYLGAMTGGMFGIVTATVFPDLASDQGLYAILGMGAVASALLGAPISTTMIVFELTGGYAVSIALLLTVSIATALHLAVHGRSFFHYQLETRGVVLAEGPHRYFLKTVNVSSFMAPIEDDADLADPDDERTVAVNDSLETALRIFNETGADALAVIDPRKGNRVVGSVSHVQALRTYNRRLEETSDEAHQ